METTILTGSIFSWRLSHQRMQEFSNIGGPQNGLEFLRIIVIGTPKADPQIMETPKKVMAPCNRGSYPKP